MECTCQVLIFVANHSDEYRFLLAKLHINSLKGKRSPRELRKSLDTLARGSDAYTEAYRTTMSRICGQLEDQKELAIQALTWIVHAQRPLTTTELQHALGVEAGELEFHEDNIPDLRDTISACCGLVTVNKESDIVRLVHYTTQEFFERQGASYLPNAHTEIVNTCVTYLSFDVFSSGACHVACDFTRRLAEFPLYEYSSRYWGCHANGLEEVELVQVFLNLPAQLEGSSQVLLNGRWPCKNKQASLQVASLHLVAYFGLSVAVARKVLEKIDVDIQDSHDRTPLSYASENGH